MANHRWLEKDSSHYCALGEITVTKVGDNYEIMIKKTVKPGFIQPWGETNLILFEILFEFLMTIFYLNSLKISVYFFIFEFLL